MIDDDLGGVYGRRCHSAVLQLGDPRRDRAIGPDVDAVMAMLRLRSGLPLIEGG
jgi:hypothetical protein